MRVLICGGGVIGASIAYFLSLKQAEAIVVERSGVACAASGKSGGFLALDWCDGTPLTPLARRSFELHAQLAGDLEGRWGYRRLDTLGLAVSARRRLSAAPDPALPDWLAPHALQRGLGTHRDHRPDPPGGVHEGDVGRGHGSGSRTAPRMRYRPRARARRPRHGRDRGR